MSNKVRSQIEHNSFTIFFAQVLTQRTYITILLSFEKYYIINGFFALQLSTKLTKVKTDAKIRIPENLTRAFTLVALCR